MKIILLAHTLRITNNSLWTGRIIGTEALMSVMTSCTREGVLGTRNLCGVYERICRGQNMRFGIVGGTVPWTVVSDHYEVHL